MPAPGDLGASSILGAPLRADALKAVSRQMGAKPLAPIGGALPEPKTAPAANTLTGSPEWSRDFVNDSLRRAVSQPLSLSGPTYAQLADAQAAVERATPNAPPLDRVAFAPHQAGELLRLIGAAPGTVTISGTGTEADGTWDLIKVEPGPFCHGPDSLAVVLVPRGKR